MSESTHYEDMVRKLVKPGEDILSALTADKANALHMALGVAGEAGELVDAIKKWGIYNKTLDRENVVEELGITRCETLEANMEKLGKRYGGMVYSDAAARARADKAEADGWIPWDGTGRRPVPPDTPVTVRFGNGHVSSDRRAGDWAWGFRAPASDWGIVAYRVRGANDAS